MDGWVKLYRKLLDHEIMRDETALVIFISILLSVDKKTGAVVTGRLTWSERLGLHPSTFYKGLKRLEEKYKMVTLSSNNKNTKVTLSNWPKYNLVTPVVTQHGNTKVTTKEQQSNTYTRIENKEINLSKDRFDRKDKRDQDVELILAEFVRITEREPCDKKPRYVAYLLKRQTYKLIEQIKPYKPLVFADVITKSFSEWMAKHSNIELKHLDTLRRDLVTGLYERTRKKYIPNYQLPSEHHDK